MQLWKQLYNTVWLAFFCCVLIPRWIPAPAGIAVHILLGIAMILLTQSNVRRLDILPVPPRLKRISKATAGLALFQIVIGLAWAAMAHLAPELRIVAILLHGAHIVCAFAILSQASSVATAYDMWEEKEFSSAPLP
jgi:hypothetical protein